MERSPEYFGFPYAPPDKVPGKGSPNGRSSIGPEYGDLVKTNLPLALLAVVQQQSVLTLHLVYCSTECQRHSRHSRAEILSDLSHATTSGVARNMNSLKEATTVLLHRQFRSFWPGRVVSSLGSAAAPVAIAFAALESGGGVEWLGFILALSVAPQVLLLLIGGRVGRQGPPRSSDGYFERRLWRRSSDYSHLDTDRRSRTLDAGHLRIPSWRGIGVLPACFPRINRPACSS